MYRGMYPAYHHSLTASRFGWPESAPFAAALGFPACDIWLQKAMEAGVDSTLETLKRYKLRTSTVDMPVDFRTSEQTFLAQLPALDGMARFAAAIGCPRMTSRVDPGAAVPLNEWRPVQLRRLRAIGEVLAKYGVRLALENIGSADMRRSHQYEFIWRMPDIIDFIDEIGFGTGLLLDSWHWHYASGTVQHILNAGRERIVHVHLNDAPEQFFDHVVDKERLMPGDGIINLSGFLGALKTLGYEGAVSVEVFATPLKTMPPEQGAKLGLDSTLKVLQAAGISPYAE